jgi:1,4-dihydroxy-2-naphthoate octaprenyltransferase
MVFFGLVAVPGTFYAQALRLVPAVWPAAVAIGATGTMILAVNNLRDLDTDARAGKRTLVVRFGRGFGRAEYVTLLLLALAMPVVIVAMGWSRWPVLLALLALPLAWPPLSRVLRTTGAALSPALGTTARFQAAFGLLLAIGAWLGHP